MKPVPFLFSPLPFVFLLTALVNAESSGPALTIYSEDFGVVRDRIRLDLSAGINEISYSGVTAQLEPESVILRDTSGKVALSIVEQSYRGDPVDETRLLQMFEGKEIQFFNHSDPNATPFKGRIIRAPKIMETKGSYSYSRRWNPYSFGHGGLLEPIIEVDGKIRIGLPGIPLFPDLGDDSILEPSLIWKLHSNETASINAQLSYLTRAMSWKSDYNLVLPQEGEHVRLTGWVSIENNTGTDFENARIKLVAGEVNKVWDSEPDDRSESVVLRSSAPVKLDEVPEVTAKKFDEFHIYSLPLATTLRDRETKQVEFVRSEKVETKKIYVYESSRARSYRSRPNLERSYGRNLQPNPAIYREFKNSEDNGLGLALPAGRMRFYRMDEDGQMEFVGEDDIKHSPKDESILVYLGNAFDIICERTQTDFFRHTSRDLIRETFEIEIRNRSEKELTVQVIEHLSRWSNWEIQDPSREFKKIDSKSIEFEVPVGAGKTETVKYTVEYTW